MSLYNMLNGFNPLAPTVLDLLGKTRADFGRFRDAYIKGGEEGKEPTLCVFTRCGGNNREYHQDVFDEMEAHPDYLRDFDDDSDCTYATIEFKVPQRFREAVAGVLKVLEETTPETLVEPMVKFNSLLRKIQAFVDGPQVPDEIPPPDVKRAMEVGSRVFEALGVENVLLFPPGQ